MANWLAMMFAWGLLTLAIMVAHDEQQRSICPMDVYDEAAVIEYLGTLDPAWRERYADPYEALDSITDGELPSEDDEAYTELDFNE